MVTFIDDYSKCVVSSFIPHKSEVIYLFLDFKAMIKNQLNLKIKCIRTDNSGKFISNLRIFAIVPVLYTKQQFRTRHSKMEWLNE